LRDEFNCGRQRPVSVSTVRRALIECGLVGRVAAKKPLLGTKNVRKRLAFAKKYVNWTTEQWSRVLWTDETKIELFGARRRVFVRRFNGERFRSFCLSPTMKFGGGSILLWGAISSNGSLPLKLINGIMDKKLYHSILVRNAVPGGLKLLKKGFIFQEDNDPKHSSHFCRNYLEKKEKLGESCF
jgi:hypothetical protein